MTFLVVVTGVILLVGLAIAVGMELDTDRQAIGCESGGNAQRRQSRHGTELTVSAALRFVDERGLTTHRRIDDRIESC